MNPERLAELQRQRALVREQLAWLDREIAAASPAVAPPGATPAPSAAPAASGADLATGPESYQPDPVAAVAQARRGCLIYLLALLLLVALALTAIYLLRYRDRPLFMPVPAAPATPAVAPKSATSRK